MLRCVLLYEYVPDGGGFAEPHAAAHARLFLDCHARGEVSMAGPWLDDSGAMGIFTDRDAAERFTQADPFIHNGVVLTHGVREWREGLEGHDAVATPKPGVKFVLFYYLSERGRELIPTHFPAHREVALSFHASGTLLMSGPFMDGDGAMNVFTTREALEEFVSVDPFVHHGVVGHWHVREWNDVLGG